MLFVPTLFLLPCSSLLISPASYLQYRWYILRRLLCVEHETKGNRFWGRIWFVFLLSFRKIREAHNQID